VPFSRQCFNINLSDVRTLTVCLNIGFDEQGRRTAFRGPLNVILKSFEIFGRKINKESRRNGPSWQFINAS
jgi:hypothetical protein